MASQHVFFKFSFGDFFSCYQIKQFQVDDVGDLLKVLYFFLDFSFQCKHQNRLTMWYTTQTVNWWHTHTQQKFWLATFNSVAILLFLPVPLSVSEKTKACYVLRGRYKKGENCVCLCHWSSSNEFLFHHTERRDRPPLYGWIDFELTEWAELTAGNGEVLW